MSIPGRLAEMAPIGLSDIADVADLQTRVDRKYLLPAAAADRLLAELAGTAQVLQVDGQRESRYASIYFDTPALDSYLSAARRRRRRFKVRTRSYLDTAGCFLEVKTRDGRGVTVKQRTDHPLGCVDVLTASGRHYVAQALAAAGIDPAAIGALVPVLRTDYRRATLYLPQSAARLTIDRSLVWRQSRGPAAPDAGSVTLGDLMVVETKSVGGRAAADRLLWTAGIRPTPLSKYATGLALLRPCLPANRWHRVLNQHIRPATMHAQSHSGALDQGGSP